MRILIVVPRQPSATGNYVTAARFSSGLRHHGHRIRIVPVLPEGTDELGRAVKAFAPDCAILLHAWRSGKPWSLTPACARIPYMVLLTGTDVHHDLDAAARTPLCRAVLTRSKMILTQNPLTAAALTARFPDWHDRIRYLPPGIILSNAPYQLRQRHNIPADAFLFLHPAGIRPVKGNLELLELFDALAHQRPQLLVAFCGPRLDQDYAARLHHALTERPWARYLGTIPPAAIPAAMRDADVILNNSESEGLPNALIEATVIGVPILARAIEGNAAVVTPNDNGLLYRTPADFHAQALRLIDEPELRRHLGRPRPERYAAASEAEQLHRLILAVTATH